MFNKMIGKINGVNNWLEVNIRINDKNNEIVVIF